MWLTVVAVVVVVWLEMWLTDNMAVSVCSVRAAVIPGYGCGSGLASWGWL